MQFKLQTIFFNFLVPRAAPTDPLYNKQSSLQLWLLAVLIAGVGKTSEVGNGYCDPNLQDQSMTPFIYYLQF